MEEKNLRQVYLDLLLGGVVPFWRRHGVDRKYGGVLSCLTEDGQVVSEEKYLWSQARWLWVCSALYNRIEPNPEFLEWGAETARFLLAHGRDREGRWVFRTDRAGRVIDGPISVFSDCFATYGLSEFARASGDRAALAAAQETFDRILVRVEAEGFADIAPYQLPAGRRIHSVPMILTEVANELAQTAPNLAAEAAAEKYALQIMNHFVRPERECLLEFLDRDFREAPPPAGTFVIPGHAIESMWFVIHWARRRLKAGIVRRAAEVVRWHLEKGWDPEFGGILSGIDIAGGTPFWPNADTKVWWPHTEALYALQLAHRATGEPWCLDWYKRVHQWSFAHFPMPGGEWRQRLDRKGAPITTVVSLPVKDPFHLPRAAILLLQLLA